MHLVFLVHGLWGHQDDMKTMHTILEKNLPSNEYLVYTAKSNTRFKTFCGIRLCALRNTLELLKVIQENEITHLTVVGYSMGGLYSRYMVGYLEDRKFFDHIVPMDFVNFATPQLGTTLWDPSIKTRIYNGLARVLLGPSGVDLMSRSARGTIHELGEPTSQYVRGIKRFKRLTSFTNALGDRTVNFWTSFATDRDPFHDDHKFTTNVKFFTFNGDPYGPTFVDLENTTLKDIPDKIVPRKSGSLPYWLAPIVIPIILTMVVYSWLKVILATPIYVFRVKRALKRLENSRSITNGEFEHVSQTSPGSKTETEFINKDPENMSLKEQLRLFVEEEIPSEEANRQSIQASVEDRSPQPFEHSDFLDNTKESKPFTKVMTTRMANFNALPWRKFIVYIRHYRTHANIIDRLHEGPSQGTEVLKFFAQDLKKAQ